MILSHIITDGLGKDHPEVEVIIKLETERYNGLDLDHTLPKRTRLMKTKALVDTRAYMVAMDIIYVHAMELTKKDLIPVKSKIGTTNYRRL